MDLALKENKQTIRGFMRARYTDAKLVELLDHARSGKLAYYSCCCFIGIPNADHELRPYVDGPVEFGDHYTLARLSTEAGIAEAAFNRLVDDDGDCSEMADQTRRRILIPMILAELRRRKLHVQPLESVTVAQEVKG